MAARKRPRNVRTVRVGNTRVMTRAQRREKLRDIYHWVLTLNWPQLFGGLILAFIVVNFVFGSIYWLLPNSVANARPP